MIIYILYITYTYNLSVYNNMYTCGRVVWASARAAQGGVAQAVVEGADLGASKAALHGAGAAAVRGDLAELPTWRHETDPEEI